MLIRTEVLQRSLLRPVICVLYLSDFPASQRFFLGHDIEYQTKMEEIAESIYQSNKGFTTKNELI